jgi:hypothetical protein
MVYKMAYLPGYFDESWRYSICLGIRDQACPCEGRGSLLQSWITETRDTMPLAQLAMTGFSWEARLAAMELL